MNRFQGHHSLSEGANDSPSTGPRAGCHHRRTSKLYPQMNFERWSVKKVQPARKVIQFSGFCGRESRQGNDTHRLLRIGKSMAPSHVGRARQLQFSEDRAHGVRPPFVDDHHQDIHDHKSSDQPDDRRTDHGDNHLVEHSVVDGFAGGIRLDDGPFDDAPVASRRSQSGTAQSSDQGMARAAGQTPPPSNQIPGNAAHHRAQNRE